MSTYANLPAPSPEQGLNRYLQDRAIAEKIQVRLFDRGISLTIESLTPEALAERWTSGQYDLLMKCDLDDKTDIGHFVTSKIQTLGGVKDTFTLITFKAFT